MYIHVHLHVHSQPSCPAEFEALRYTAIKPGILTCIHVNYSMASISAAGINIFNSSRFPKMHWGIFLRWLLYTWAIYMRLKAGQTYKNKSINLPPKNVTYMFKYNVCNKQAGVVGMCKYGMLSCCTEIFTIGNYK